MNPKSQRYTDHPVYQRLMASGPKRILALDGGGIRGALTLGYLEKIEEMLRLRYNDPSLVLSDYFDMVGGTSTGALIATLVAVGWEIRDIVDLYMERGEKIFTRRKHLLNRGILKYLLSAEYRHDILEEILLQKEYIGDRTLGSRDFKTGLAIFAKRADTMSTWVFHNHPRHAYYEANKTLKVADLLRATSAAPTFFAPKELILSDQQSAVFIDGGVSMANNPALMLFLMTTIQGYGYGWRKGSDHLQLISVGTGYGVQRVEKEEKTKLLKRKSLRWAAEVPEMFMADAVELNQLMLQYMSHPKRPSYINREAGDLSDDLLTPEPLLEYIRYNIALEPHALREIGINQLSDEEIAGLLPMDRAKNAKQLYTIGQRAARQQVEAKEWSSTFDYGIKGRQILLLSQQEAMSQILPILLSDGVRYQKYGQIIARQAIDKEEVVSITKYGIETHNTAEPGDYIVTNSTDMQEQYVLDSASFSQRYQHLRDMAEGRALYQAVGEIIGIQLTQGLLEQLSLPFHWQLMPVWEQPQYIGVNDYLVTPMDHSEIYRVALDEFRQTYHKKDKKQ